MRVRDRRAEFLPFFCVSTNNGAYCMNGLRYFANALLGYALSLALPHWAARADETSAPEARLTSTCVVRFATPAEAAKILQAKDDYLTRLSRFDLQVRQRTGGEVTLAGFANFLAGETLAWQPDQIAKLTAIIAGLQAKLKHLNLPFPNSVLLILTTGREEDNAAYTRGHAVILPRNKVAASSQELEKLLAHELFHVLSRHNPELRQKLYAMVGYEPCNEIALPAKLVDRGLHNPDAPVCNCYTLLRHEGVEMPFAPVLIASQERYNPEQRGGLFRHLQFRMLALEQQAGAWRPQLINGEPLLIDPTRNDSFYARIGRNTSYIIHPEEILADNFMHLVMGTKNLPTPKLLDDLRRELEQGAKP